jgi:hypothetical protein
MDSQASPPSSLADELVAGFIGAGVAAGCLLVPLLHLVTAPLGPAIGAFVAANRVKPGPRALAVVAVTIASVLAGFVATVLGVVSSIASKSELPDWFPSSPPQIAVLAAVVWGYAAVVASIGAAVRGAIADTKGD